MMRSTRAGSFLAALVVAGLGLAALPLNGCDRKPESPARTTGASLGTPSAVYTVRGRVVALPDPAAPASAFEVQHEAIDNFVDSKGEVVGMAAMVMPFPLADGVSVSDLSTGDVVEVTFAVWWEPRSYWEATEVVKLPQGTPLEFREARPPRDDESEGQNTAPPADPPSADPPPAAPTGG